MEPRYQAAGCWLRANQNEDPVRTSVLPGAPVTLLLYCRSMFAVAVRSSGRVAGAGRAHLRPACVRARRHRRSRSLCRPLPLTACRAAATAIPARGPGAAQCGVEGRGRFPLRISPEPASRPGTGRRTRVRRRKAPRRLWPRTTDTESWMRPGTTVPPHGIVRVQRSSCSHRARKDDSETVATVTVSAKPIINPRLRTRCPSTLSSARK